MVKTSKSSSEKEKDNQDQFSMEEQSVDGKEKGESHSNKSNKETDVQCSDPEIEAWLNEGDKDETEQTMDMKPLVDEIDDKDCDETRSMAVIENQSEVAYHDDGDMCIISDAMIAKMMRNMGRKKKGVDVLECVDELEEEEAKPKKMNRNSRALKKEREERKLEALKAKEEREKKEQEQLKEIAQKPVSKFAYERPVKKTSSSLQNLAKKHMAKKS